MVLPKSLIYLKLSDCYNKLIKKNVIPTSLHTLVLGDKYTKSLRNVPNTIHTIILSYYHLPRNFIKIIESLPSNIKILKIRKMNMYDTHKKKYVTNELVQISIEKGFTIIYY